MPSTRKTRGLWLLLPIVILAGVLACKAIGRWTFERLLTRFEANPSEQTAEPLVDLLADGKATQADGQRILLALLAPRATAESDGKTVWLEVRPSGSFGLARRPPRFLVTRFPELWIAGSIVPRKHSPDPSLALESDGLLPTRLVWIIEKLSHTGWSGSGTCQGKVHAEFLV